MDNIYKVLSKLEGQGKIKLFSPFYNGIVLKQSYPDLRKKMKEAWDLDIAKIEASDLIVACTQDYDVGVIFECGYASARGKTIICYNSQPGHDLNVMLAQAMKDFVRTEEDLQNAVESFCAEFKEGNI